MRKNTGLLLVLVFLSASFMITSKPASGAASSENTWVTRTPMPSILSHPKAAVVGGKIYVVGVPTGEKVTDSLFEYDPVTDNWTARKPMPSLRYNFAVAAYQNRLYIIGGTSKASVDYYDPDAGLSTNEVYDTATDSWETRASMPTARWGLVAETVNGKIYVIGGRTGGAQTSVKTNEVYDPLSDSWTTASSIPTAVCGPTSAFVDNRIFVIGGQAEFNKPMNPGLNQIYTPQTDTWVQAAKEPNPEWNAAAAGATTGVLAPKIIYIMGGNPGFAPPLDQNYAYIPKDDRWIIAASLPAPKSSFAVAVVNDLIYVIGGTTVNYGVLTASVEQYTPFLFGTIPTISIISPKNVSYRSRDIPLNFSIAEATSWIGYSIDDQTNVILTGNVSFAELAEGTHTVRIYAKNFAEDITSHAAVGFTVDLSSPSVVLESPENKTYRSADIPLIFTVNESTSKNSYVLDGQDNVTIAESITLTELPLGAHIITVYVWDAAGNIGYTETVTFTVAEPEPFPFVPVAVAVTVFAVASATLLVYFKKRVHRKTGLSRNLD